MTAKDCRVWVHEYQGWGYCPAFPKKGPSDIGGNLHMYDPACDNNCVEVSKIDTDWYDIYEEIYQQDEYRKTQIEIMRKEAMMNDPNYLGQPPE